MNDLHLFMTLVGCRPVGRNTEQHDVFFGIGKEVKDLIPELYNFWPEAKKKIHLDAWREVNYVDEYKVELCLKEPSIVENYMDEMKLFFINLGGYKPNEFDEFHYKIIVAATDKNAAIKKAKLTTFFQHTGFKGAPSHIDDKFGIDVDDIFEIKDILPVIYKNKYKFKMTKSSGIQKDQIHLGFMKLDKL